MEPKTGKRIVSKQEYARALGKKTWVYFNAFASLVCMPFLAYSVLFQHGFSGWRISFFVVTCIVFIPSGVRTAKEEFNKARQMDFGVLLTRANTADLPAPESLVRASSEPLQAQEDVLLRAAAQGVETPPEQLVRASVGVNREENAL